MKSVSKAFQNMENDKILKAIKDGSVNLVKLMRTVNGHWSYDLNSRKVGKFLDSDEITLDMACMMSTLADRKAIVNIPYYKAMGEKKTTSGEHVVGAVNRHGKMISVGSNQNNFNFGFTIIDANVITEHEIGKPRRFNITDMNGTWYNGLSSIQVMLNEQEDDKLKDVIVDNKISFRYFIHPNRVHSLFGMPYFCSKLLEQRAAANIKHINKEIKQLHVDGFSIDPDTKDEWPKSKGDGDTKSLDIDKFEVEIDYPMPTTIKFDGYESSQEGLEKAYDDKKAITKELQKLRFAIRASEYAFYKWGSLDSFPKWIKGAEWETDYTPPKKRTKWNRLVLLQQAVGEHGVAIRTRLTTKKTTVASSYELA